MTFLSQNQLYLYKIVIINNEYAFLIINIYEDSFWRKLQPLETEFHDN